MKIRHQDHLKQSHPNSLQFFQNCETKSDQTEQSTRSWGTPISLLPPVSFYPLHPQRHDGGRQTEGEAEGGEMRERG